MLAEDAGCCQLQVTSVTAVSVLALGKQLLKSTMALRAIYGIWDYTESLY